MGTAYKGTFVISWSQTTIDTLQSAPVDFLRVGVAWSWTGDAVRVDGPNDLVRLDEAEGEADRRRRAARMVRRLVGAAMEDIPDPAALAVDHPIADKSFVVTDGGTTYTVTLIETGPQKQPLLMFLDGVPPRDHDLWVVHATLATVVTQTDAEHQGAVICFTPETRILTPDGVKLIHELREGDYVQTKDNGAQPIQWMGQRRMSGARLFAMPKLRPIRIRAGVFGLDEPDEDLLVSPEHRMLIKGRVAMDLFNTPEVLVAARDLVDHERVSVDLNVREITYVHMLLPQHEILFANGVESESFHPANAALSTLDPQDRDRLGQMLPNVEYNPQSYGSYARRNLSASETAILLHEAA
ncbi:Hint domain-containing protein [Marivita geojedonensis]|uniref:Hemolysin-type calcium-binding protein n=1 Tax=Marivita geojedonensis TaxID=1123756 RepID=A0A1X4NIB5_9RHOB|nr:Hint domain-containing protein [Marivita geojedonensis]OSQ48195.1 hemolysin-type calcium-binding protein [Marivita geojedonensis]PRY74938.1 intein [Marivita geojedonensis]